MEVAEELAGLRILICDDEVLARARLRDLLTDRGLAAWVVGEAGKGSEVLRQCVELEPDLILLDIRMPGKSGLEAAQELVAMNDPPTVIFTTAYDQHALQAFDSQAVDYLLKPIRRERLAAALDKAVRINRAQRGRLPAEPASDSTRRSHLPVSSRGSLRALPLADIRYLHAEHKYVTVGTTRGEALVEESLTSLEDEFGDLFVRIHRNALVARAHLVALEKDADGHTYARLADVDVRLEISRRHIPVIRQLLKDGLPG